MTKENRQSWLVSDPGEYHSNECSPLINDARKHAQSLVNQGKTPQMVSVATHEYLLKHHFTGHIIQRRESPFDLLVETEGKQDSVYIDIECHGLVNAALNLLLKGRDAAS